MSEGEKGARENNYENGQGNKNFRKETTFLYIYIFMKILHNFIVQTKSFRFLCYKRGKKKSHILIFLRNYT